MDNNCLVTRLKGTVDNPNLPKFGLAQMTLVSGTRLFLGTKAPVTLTIVGGSGVFSNVGSSITVESSTKIIIPTAPTEYSIYTFDISGGDAVVIADSKYNINKIKFSAGSGGIVNLEDFTYSSLGWLISSVLNNIHGDIACLPEQMSYVQIAGNTNVVGDVENLPNVEGSMRIQNTGLHGDLEKYVEKLFHKGYLHTNLSCYFGGGDIKLGGRTWSNAYECLITVTANDATIDMGSYVNETYDGTSWHSNL